MIPNLCAWWAAQISSGSAVRRFRLSSVVSDSPHDCCRLWAVCSKYLFLFGVEGRLGRVARCRGGVLKRKIA